MFFVVCNTLVPMYEISKYGALGMRTYYMTYSIIRLEDNQNSSLQM